jgi:hypothetical protein
MYLHTYTGTFIKIEVENTLFIWYYRDKDTRVISMCLESIVECWVNTACLRKTITHCSVNFVCVRKTTVDSWGSSGLCVEYHVSSFSVRRSWLMVERTQHNNSCLIITKSLRLTWNYLKIYPCNRPWRPIGLWEFRAHIFSRQSPHRWRWGCKPYAPTAFYPPRKIPGTHFYWRLSRPQSHSVAGRITSIEKKNPPHRDSNPWPSGL